MNIDRTGLTNIINKVEQSTTNNEYELFQLARLRTIETQLGLFLNSSPKKGTKENNQVTSDRAAHQGDMTFNTAKWHLGDTLIYESEQELRELHPAPDSYLERTGHEIQTRKQHCIHELVSLNTQEFSRYKWNIDNIVENMRREITSDFDRTEPEYYDDQKQQTINDLLELKTEIELYTKEIDHAIINHSRLPLERLELTLIEHPQRKETIEGICWTFENERNIALNDTPLRKLDGVKYMATRSVSQSDFDVEELIKERIHRKTSRLIPESFRKNTPENKRIPLLWINSHGTKNWKQRNNTKRDGTIKGR